MKKLSTNQLSDELLADIVEFVSYAIDERLAELGVIPPQGGAPRAMSASQTRFARISALVKARTSSRVRTARASKPKTRAFSRITKPKPSPLVESFNRRLKRTGRIPR